jgi:hypothetical protein
MADYIVTHLHPLPFARINGVALNPRAFRETWQSKVKETVYEDR